MLISTTSGRCVDVEERANRRAIKGTSGECGLCGARAAPDDCPHGVERPELTRRSAPKKVLHPTPHPMKRPTTFAIKSIVVIPSPLFLAATARRNLFRSPLAGPSDFASTNPVVGLARLLPVTYRWREGRTAICFLESPFRRTKWRPDLGAASARARMGRRRWAAAPNSSDT